VRRLWQALVAFITTRVGKRRRERASGSGDGAGGGPGRPGSELAVVLLLLLAAGAAIGFVVVYALERFSAQHELLGVTLALAFAFVAAALVVLGRRLLPAEELEEDYPEPEHAQEQAEVAETLEQSVGGITRKRLLAAAGGTAGGAIGLAALTPALSLGPWFDVDPLYRTPWRPGRRLVDDKGEPMLADDVEHETFYTAFAEGASDRNVGSSLVVVRLDPADLRLPAERANWAPEGILAFSKVCPHAGCAVALYRKPTYGPTQPEPALVCPCHYSTFDPSTGGDVLFGPAGRPLPQLPLAVDSKGELRASGNFSAALGPSWWGVNMEKPR
jgi:ubiquinol-cytochrome c reductase iron-sulfur subunit